MADDYSGRCALCEHFNLYDRFWDGTFRCMKQQQYFTVFERQGSCFEPAREPLSYRIEKIEKARENKL